LIDLIEKKARASGLPARRLPPFRLAGDQIYSLYPLAKPNSVFRSVISVRQCLPKAPETYLHSADDRMILISLLNMSVQSHAFSLGLQDSYEIGRGRRYFFPPGHGKKEKRIDWKPSRKTARRIVSKPLRPEDPKSEWLHAGAYLDVVELAGDLFLKVRPTWVVTVDGRHPKSGLDVGRIVNRWTNRERNLSILYHIRFWTTILSAARPDIEARTHSGLLRISSTAAQLELPFGIASDVIDPEKLLDVEAKLIADSEHELVSRAIEYLANEEWEIEGEDDGTAEGT
jgi:hypothetical protein